MVICCGLLEMWQASRSAAGATTSLLLYHLDYARTRLGTDSTESPITDQRQFKGLLDVYCKTISSDGIAGPYRGFGASIMGITLYTGMYMKPLILVGPFEGNFIASFFWVGASPLSGVCAYPFDTLRWRMMLTCGQPLKYRNSLHAFREIVHRKEFAALYRGVTANMLVCVGGAGVLAGYDQLQRIALRHGYGEEPSANTLK